jgi:hypothetical protein
MAQKKTGLEGETLERPNTTANPEVDTMIKNIPDQDENDEDDNQADANFGEDTAEEENSDDATDTEGDVDPC